MASPAKKHRTLQKFIPEYTNLWPVLKQSKIGDNHAFCEVCKADFSIWHGGRDDCHRHVSCWNCEIESRKYTQSKAVSYAFGREDEGTMIGDIEACLVKMSRYGSDNECKLYIGDLARDTTEKDIERAFSYYGRLRSVWVARNPAGFAFVEYEDPRDADDAVRGLDGSSVCGARVRVEHSSGKSRSRSRGGGGGYRGGGGGGSFGGGRGGGRGRRPFNPDDRCYQCGEPGHYAYDCTRSSGSRGGGGGYRKSSRYSRSRSRSRSRSYKRSYSRSRSRSPSRKKYRRSSSRDRRPSRSDSRSRSRSPVKNGD